jgi:hypothetical protein
MPGSANRWRVVFVAEVLYLAERHRPLQGDDVGCRSRQVFLIKRTLQTRWLDCGRIVRHSCSAGPQKCLVPWAHYSCDVPIRST